MARYDDDDDDRPHKRRPRDENDDDRPRKRRSRRDEDEEDEGDDTLGTVIPYRNGYALTAYYLGIFGLFSCFFAGAGVTGVGGHGTWWGILALVPFIVGLVPFVFGILGFMRARRNPAAHGTVHAWIGILLGALEMFFGCGGIGFFIFTMMNKR